MEPISVRVAQLNSRLTSSKVVEGNFNLISREGLLDAVTVLYNECNSDCLKKYDQEIACFVDKQKSTLNELKCMRINLSDFEIKQRIGRGQFGEVHLVKEKQTGDVYALKIIKKLQDRHMFVNERNILACARSLWLTSSWYAFQDNNNLYFVMEYCAGGDLMGLLHRQGGTIPESAASFYIAELVMAINDLHNIGYIHHDVKLENILLDRCGHIKLADFGSSTGIDEKNSLDKNNKHPENIFYDYWSVGVVGYHLTVGNRPDFKSDFIFPPDIILTQAYVSLIKLLVSKPKFTQILEHPVFKDTDFHRLRDQVPPYVPKVISEDDVSNFCDVPFEKREPNIENFKTKTQFSGKQLPYIGFTYVRDFNEYKHNYSHTNDKIKNEHMEELQKEVSLLQHKLSKTQDAVADVEVMEKKFTEKSKHLESLESLRNNLERELANSIAECTSLKRTLSLERKDRSNLEHKALELIKGAKLKWENSEKMKVDALNLEIAQQKEKIEQLTATNSLLNDQLQHALHLEHKYKTSLESVESKSRKSVIGLESRLERITIDTCNKVSELQSKINKEAHEKMMLENQLSTFKCNHKALEEKFLQSEENCNGFLIKLEANQTLIKELEGKINILKTSAKAVEEYKERSRALEAEVEKLQNDRKVEEIERKFKNEQDVRKELEVQLQSLKNEFNEMANKYEVSLKKEKDDFNKQLTDVSDHLYKMTQQKDNLELQLQAAAVTETNYKVKVKMLEELLQRLESGISKLETDCENKNVLSEQIQRLERQLIEVHEKTVLEKQELSQLKTKLWRVEKDLSNAEIDKRIYKRELKESEDQNKKLTSDLEEVKLKMTENKVINESVVTELGNLNEEFGNEIVRLKEIIKNLEDKIVSEKEKFEQKINNISKLRTENETKDSKISKLLGDLKICEEQQQQLNRKIEILESDKMNLKLQVDSAVRERDIISNGYESCKHELQNTQLNLVALREACTLLESQLNEYENIHATHETKQQSLNSNVEKLIGKLTKAEEDIEQAKKLVNEEKSLKSMAQAKCKRLAEDIECIQKECSSYKQQCIDYRQYSSNLTDELTIIEEKLADSEVTIKTYERKISNISSENRVLKEENSAQLTHLSSMKESKRQLTQDLAEAKRNNSILLQNISELQNTIEQKAYFYKERELKANSTIEQQIKLIDFLQSKVEEGKKKKTLSDKLFGHSKKENQPPFPVTLNYKDLENMLHKEKDANKKLREEISKLKVELNHKREKNAVDSCILNAPISPRTKVAMEKLTQSPSTQKTDLQRQNSNQRMYHNIPHRFESKLCTKATKCTYCSNATILGRNIKYCTECNVVVHTYCCKYLPKTCGVPQAFVKHYSDSLLQTVEVPKNESDHQISETINIEGWVKILKENTGWEKCYVCLSPSTLKIYSQQPININVTPSQTFELQVPNSHGVVVLDPVLTDISVPVASSDLPFIIKVEIVPNTTCWPKNSVTIMTLNTDDKNRWCNALQTLFHSLEPKYTGETILKCRQQLNINCLVDLNENTKLLGTDEGLYSYRNNNLLNIMGLLHIYQIAILPTLNLIVMIADINRSLITCNLNHVISLSQCAPCSKPTLSFKVVNIYNLNGFHLFQASDFKRTFMLAVATSKQLIITNYDQNLCEFVPIRILDTAEPTSCILYTEHSLIVGTDKFFEIDLTNFDADEFLDGSDQNLVQALMCHSIKSFPLAIMQITNNPVEYLLCFHEFGVFVDEFGRCSRRTEIKWSRLPCMFYFSKPYLYIVQFTCVEIIKVIPETCNLMKDSMDSLLNVDSFNVNINSPCYLGNGKNGIYVYSCDEIKYIKAKKVDDDSVSINSENVEENESRDSSEEFSFTSSMVQSLDDNLSETESEITEEKNELVYRQKKVKFNSHMTDL